MSTNTPPIAAADHPSDPLPLKTSRSRPRFGLRRRTVADAGNEIWFLTLSDLLLLLVIFFVLLFGLTWQQSQQAKALPDPPEARRIVFSPVQTLPPPPASDPAELLSPAPPLENALKESLRIPGASGVTLEQRGPALVLTFPERIVFDTGEARLKAGADPILADVGDFIRQRPDLLVEVHGHTDDRPIRNARYPSNWELSADRATQVARALIARGVSPQQLSVKGFGEFRALVPNDTEDNRLKNRRVEIHFARPDPQPAPRP